MSHTTQSCTICAELTTNQYHSGCCGAWLCSDCFGLLDPGEEVTCGRCSYPVQPVNTTVAISSMIIVATAMTTAAIKLDLAQVQLDINLVRTALAELVNNIAELNQELNDNSVGVTRAQLTPEQIIHLGQQLETFNNSQTKSLQLKLDQLLNYHKLLQCRLETLTQGGVSDLVNNRVNLLTLTERWSDRFRDNDDFDHSSQQYHRRVWWRRNSRFNTPWQLMPSSAMPQIKQIGDGEYSHSKFFTRLADDRLALVEVKVQSEQILLIVTAMVKNQQWQVGVTGEPNLTLTMPRPYSSKPAGLAMGIIMTPGQVQGYYCYYSVDRLTLLGIQKLLLVQDFGLDGSLRKNYRITLPARPSQVYRYDNTLLAIVADRLTVIRLDSGIVTVSAQTDLSISRCHQDQLWLNWNNQEIWQYSFEDLIVNGLSLVKAELSPPALSKSPYLGPTDHSGYLEVVTPGAIVYCHYGKQILTTGYGQIYDKSFRSVAVADDGVICVV